ncbi:MAG TPA: SDR family oxidoreductase [Dehalococcoidia bacterium]|nr:SDR family oxidoreductase [Dehalococcoidia bacterium]
MRSEAKTILLTGGSGVVGQALLERLTDVNVIGLTHRTPIEAPNVEMLIGDISKPQLGLSTDQFEDLCRRVDYVVHSAATTSFADSKAATYRTNVEGTRNILEVADRAGVPFCHISTAFAHLQQFDGTHLSNFYEASKLESEEVVQQSGVPYVILRPSVVIGDSNDGHMSRFQGFHFLSELMFRGVLPVWVPTKPTAYMDFIPQDMISEVVSALVERPEIRGEYWLTSGPRAMQVEQAVTLWEQHIPRLTGRGIKRPRYVDPDVIDRLIKPVFLPSLPARSREMVGQALELLSFSVKNPLPTSMPELESLLNIPRSPDPELVAIRNAEFWARKRGFDQAVRRDNRELGNQLDWNPAAQ